MSAEHMTKDRVHAANQISPFRSLFFECIPFLSWWRKQAYMRTGGVLRVSSTSMEWLVIISHINKTASLAEVYEYKEFPASRSNDE